MTPEQLRGLIRDVPDFPKPGIVFKDITPLLEHPQAFRSTIERLAEGVDGLGAQRILAIESRGFIFGAALAHELGLPMHLVRKRGKLPRESISVEYTLEYGVDHLEVHADAIVPGERYLVVDDLIATGGTAAAVGELVSRQSAVLAGYAFVIELAFLSGRKALGDVPVVALIDF
ncbi:MAG: adenine phosphoribosyltransferase [Gammaproteobacteria bacterium]|nr:adenine phosphoribosyltransferase [Gammaproteobacteria bacterium]